MPHYYEQNPKDEQKADGQYNYFQARMLTPVWMILSVMWGCVLGVTKILPAVNS